MGTDRERATPDGVLPVRRTRAEARATYDRISRVFDVVEGPFERRFREAGLELLAPRTGERILEIGFGTGSSLVRLARGVGDGGGVVGLDISEGMAQVATRKLVRAGSAGRVLLALGDAARLPFGPERFDGVFMTFVLELFDTPEIPVVLAECHRVLRGGGRLVVVAMSSGSRWNRRMQAYAWGHRVFPRLLDCRPIPVEAFLAASAFAPVRARRSSIAGLPIDVVLATP